MILFDWNSIIKSEVIIIKVNAPEEAREVHQNHQVVYLLVIAEMGGQGRRCRWC